MTIPRTTPTRSLAAALTASLLAVGVVGCTSKTTTTDTTTTTATATASGKATVTAPPLPAEPTFKGSWAGALVDVKIDECPLDAGEQTVKVTVKNSTDKPRDYAIMVFWLMNDSGTPYGSTMLTARRLGAGKSVQLTGKAKVVKKVERCGLNVRAGALK